MEKMVEDLNTATQFWVSCLISFNNVSASLQALSTCKAWFILEMHKSRSVRSFSSSKTGPFILFNATAKPLPEGGNIGEVVVFDMAKAELLELTEKTIPGEIVSAKGLGASKGWGIFSDPQDRCVLITDFMNPWSCKSNPKLFTLPPLTPLPLCQTDVVWSVAMSSCPDDDQDWVVGIKSLGDQLSFCRPRRDLRWTKIQTPRGHFPTSNLMYSKRDGRFYLPALGGHHLLSYDLHLDKPEFHELQFRDFPESLEPELDLSELISSSSRTEHLVESPSGDERFLIKWYANSCLASKKVSYETQLFMVFREEETTEGRLMCYTDDIGDLCIFISKGEAFCVPASSFPGLQPNSIYFIGFGFGVHDLTTRTTTTLQGPKDSLDQVLVPYWFPPSSS
ncbi:unnamed protein product [Thlaspi arvense]|uniref:KIB1-4 beta-propeller domain-containing protein n=1 Tax=Thlaspi arvense TaxID=13288 RepID=A0AAU9RAW6_THLAR|nr:unnamed protein product [Thlaspi arvense]